MMQSFRRPAAIFPQADPAGHRADAVHQLEGQYQPGDPRGHHRRAVGAVTGIGHQLSVAEELFSVSDVFAWTVILVVLLFLLEGLVARVEARMLRWRA